MSKLVMAVSLWKKNRSWLFNSSFWKERVVLNDDIWEKNQKNFLIRILRQKLLRKRLLAFQQQIQNHYLQNCVSSQILKCKNG